MKPFSATPIRRLEGITYWVIEDPDAIHDYINTEIRKEWEADAQSEHRNPKDDLWLKTLPQRKWNLEIAKTARIRLNPDLMSYVDARTGYNFSEHLAERSRELKEGIETYGLVIWPVIVRGEDCVLMDGYCRYSALRAMKIRETYAYIGTLQTRFENHNAYKV